MTKLLEAAPLTEDLVAVERLDGERWTARCTLARITVVTWYALPVLAAFAVTSVATKVVGRPIGIVDQLAWFAGLTAIASLVVHADGGGSVAVDDVGTPASPPVTIVEVPAAGQALCQAAEVCRPITITVPLSAP